MSLIRDGLIFVMLIWVIISKKLKLEKKLLLILAFIAYGALSYFWKEPSTMQWLRGFRFTFIPLLLLLIVSNLELKEKERKSLLTTVLTAGLMIVLISIAELCGFRIPLTSELSGSLGMEKTQYLEGNHIRRLQAVLAGPNALGLYMLALVAYTLGLFNEVSKKIHWLIPILILVVFFTFSRSSLIGLILILFISCYFYSVRRFGISKTIGWFATFLFVIFLGGFWMSRSADYSNFFTHGSSSVLRLEQMERVWKTKNEIGLLGRGSGTAGPSSQFRLDGGPNRWTENIYLDIFEELGLIGLVIYLSIIISLIRYSWRYRLTQIGKTAFLINMGFAISGLFINYYTGQAGIYLLWLSNGLLMDQIKNQEVL